jgi:hypothetical protein
MKKNVYFFLILAVVMAAVAIKVAQAQSLEKILSPDQIKYYQKIEKRGIALYGLKSQAVEAALRTNLASSTKPLNLDQAIRSQLLVGSSATSTPTSWSSSTKNLILEKILSPDQIKYYQKIEKKGTALYGLRIMPGRPLVKPLNASSTTSIRIGEPNPQSPMATSSNWHPDYNHQSTEASTTATTIEGANPTDALDMVFPSFINSPAALASTTMRSAIIDCVSSAIDVRDKALVQVETSHASAFTALINTRSVCQQAAIKADGNQKEAMLACFNDFNQAKKTLDQQNQTSHQAAQDTYRNGITACYKSLPLNSGAATSTSGGGNSDQKTGDQ